jgi:hypothetical protein
MLFSDDEDDDAVAAPAEESSRVALIPPMVFSPALPARMVPHAADQHSASRNIFITFSPDGPTTSPRSSRSTPARDVETVMEAATLEAPCITFSPDEHVGDASGEVAGDSHDLDVRVQPRTLAPALCAGLDVNQSRRLQFWRRSPIRYQRTSMKAMLLERWLETVMMTLTLVKVIDRARWHLYAPVWD